MNKAQINLSLQTETIDTLRNKAAEVDAHLGDLADLLLRYALTHIQDDALRAWVKKQPNVKGRNAGGLRRDERVALEALETLSVQPIFRLELDEVADTAGLLRKDCLLALASLKLRGLVAESHRSEKLDRWGRPVSSIWRLDPPPAWAPKPGPQAVP